MQYLKHLSNDSLPKKTVASSPIYPLGIKARSIGAKSAAQSAVSGRAEVRIETLSPQGLPSKPGISKHFL